MRKGLVVAGLCAVLVAAFVRTSDALSVASGDAYAVGTRPTALISVDLQHDGLTDMLTMNASETSSILLGQSDGSFTTSSEPINVQPSAIAVGDVNGDHKPDLASVGLGSGRIELHYGDGTGAFPGYFVLKTDSTKLVSVALGDLDADGRADLVTNDGAGVRVNLTRTGEQFPLAKGSPFALRWVPSILAAADMNGDRWPDVVAVSTAGGSVSVMRGSSGGVLSLVSTHSVNTRIGAIVVDDLNGDGRNDVGVAEPDAGAVEVLAGDGAGNLNSGVHMPVGADPHGLADGDLNGDGRADLVAASDADDTMTILLSDGAGSFAPSSGSPFAVDGGPGAVAVLDTDHDGLDDVVLARSARNDLVVERNESMQELDVSPSSLEMGESDVGSAGDPATVSVSSSGLTSTVTGVDVSGDDFSIANDACTGRTVGDGYRPCEVSVRFTPQAEGERDGTLEIADDAGSEVTVTLHGTGIDTTPPETTITGSPQSLTNDPDATFTFAADDPDARFECSVDGSTFDACESPYSATLADGEHEFDVRGIDEVGNVDPTPASVVFTIDTTPPHTTITSESDGASPVFTFTSDDATATFECRMDDAPFAPCTSPYHGGPLEAGTHTFEVRATDAAGNVDVNTATSSFTVDDPQPGPAPETTIVEHPDSLTSDTTPTFRFVSDEPGATFECSVDGADFTDCASPYTTDELDEGRHVFQVAALDGSGVADPTPDAFVVTVDVTAPNTSISGPSRSTRKNALFNFRFSEDVASVWCSLDGTGYSECRTPYGGRALRRGRHILRVVAVDAAGNRETSPAVKRFRIVRAR